MPENRPKDFVVQYYTSGGMLNLGENIYISGDSCRYTEHYNNAVSRTKFTISNSLFDSLYKIFRDNKFDKIETYDEHVYDRGGESITIYWGKTTYAVSNSGMTFIKDKWQDEWTSISTSFLKLVGGELNKYKIEFPIYIDKELAGRQLNIRFNTEKVYGDVMVSSDEPFKITTKQLQGSYYVSIQLTQPYKDWINTVDITKTKGLKISFINDELKVIELE